MAGTRGYPKNVVELHDYASIPTIDVEYARDDTPIVAVTFTADKGPEDWTMIRSFGVYTALYGGTSFEKHGQSQLIAAEVLRAGGYVFGKRMVSSNATLANTTIRAKVVTTDDVHYIYTYAISAANAYSSKIAEEIGFDNYDYEDFDATDFPLFTIYNSGRGASDTYFRITPEYNYSKASSSIRYSIEVIEDNSIIDSIVFSLNPELVVNNVPQAMERKINGSGNIRCKFYEKGFYGLVRLLATTATLNGSPVEAVDMVNYDVINGLSKNGTALGNVVAYNDSGSVEDNAAWVANRPTDINGTVIYLGTAAGIPLLNGSYGDSGAFPIDNKAEYTKLLLGAWGKNQDSEQFDPIIYDLDAVRIAAVFDGNYPLAVKNAINDVADWRGDFCYFADVGTENTTTIDNILNIAEQINSSRYNAIYANYGDIIDPFSKKQITVTLPLLLARRFIAYCRNTAGYPFAGIANGFSFDEFIDGTINFLPVVIPGVDQKQQLADACVNYVNYYDGLPVLDTLYVNYPEYTQLSFLHNILNIQRVIRAIRAECPRIRFKNIGSSDTQTNANGLDDYLDAVNSVISKYQSGFKSLTMQYMADEKYELNKIFYAVLTVQFFDFFQEELFKIYAVN